jgi:hypothetical protein
MGVAGGDGRRTARSQGECSESRIEGGDRQSQIFRPANT